MKVNRISGTVIERAKAGGRAQKRRGAAIPYKLQLARGMFRTEVSTRDPRDRPEIKAALKRAGIKANSCNSFSLSLLFFSLFFLLLARTDLSEGANMYQPQKKKEKRKKQRST